MILLSITIATFCSDTLQYVPLSDAEQREIIPTLYGYNQALWALRSAPADQYYASTAIFCAALEKLKLLRDQGVIDPEDWDCCVCVYGKFHGEEAIKCIGIDQNPQFDRTLFDRIRMHRKLPSEDIHGGAGAGSKVSGELK